MRAYVDGNCGVGPRVVSHHTFFIYCNLIGNVLVAFLIFFNVNEFFGFALFYFLEIFLNANFLVIVKLVHIFQIINLKKKINSNNGSNNNHEKV